MSAPSGASLAPIDAAGNGRSGIGAGSQPPLSSAGDKKRKQPPGSGGQRAKERSNTEDDGAAASGSGSGTAAGATSANQAAGAGAGSASASSTATPTAGAPTTTAPPANRPREAKRTRVHFSCVECHRRKQKCDRKEPCSQCVARRVPHLCRPFLNGVEDPNA